MTAGRPAGDEEAALPLRERKKRQTRQRISDVATVLFVERGFDKVTVAEIARAAGVSTMTVFNYFPRKEDLFLDRIPEAVEVFSEAVRRRGPGETPLAALRRLALELLDARHPLSGIADRFPPFWRIVLDSPGLRARAREGVEEVEAALAAAFADAGVAAADLLAALTVAAYRSVYVASARRLLAGERAEGIAEGHRARIGAAFDALERTLLQEGGGRTLDG
ncbi:TetR family transcriptional regulator [Streptomyces sp. NPDC048045]|uniref:TetR/AcrR family transcriptional regulator n=1 Tax=Streptomyces sp. NPDC048045 TaxID=3154710 RepID=UPI0034156610